MNNQTKPDGAGCPRCAGLYVWDGSAHHCINCGFVFNPKVEIRPVIREKCTWGSCVGKIAPSSSIYCEKHQLQALHTHRKLAGVDPNRPIVPRPKSPGRRFDFRNEDLKARHAFPIPVKLRKDPDE